MSREMAHKVIVPPKKIRSKSFLNSGTLIVIIGDSLVGALLNGGPLRGYPYRCTYLYPSEDSLANDRKGISH